MELLTDKVIYHVETQEDYDDLIRRLEKLGCEWIDNDFGKTGSYFPYFGENTAIRIGSKKIRYSSLNYYLNNLNNKYENYQIIKYKKEQNMKVKLKASEKFIADWYEDCKDDFDENLYNTLIGFYFHGDEYGSYHDLYSWMEDTDDYIQTLVKMHIFGYEIEQEKLYTVEIPNPNNIGNEFLVLMRNGFKQIVALTKSGKEWRNQKAFQLTENEIKKDFAWAWDFAKEV